VKLTAYVFRRSRLASAACAGSFVVALCACTRRPERTTATAADGGVVDGELRPPLVEAGSSVSDEARAVAAADEAPSATERLLDEAADAGPCRAPLDQWCSGPCATYDEALAKEKSRGREIACRVGSVEAGECGAFRFVAVHGGFENRTQYFGKDGRLVGVVVSADAAIFCGRRRSGIVFGNAPTCTRRVAAKICNPKDIPVRCQCGDPLCSPTPGADCAQ
jgi:hypothetical protein